MPANALHLPALAAFAGWLLREQLEPYSAFYFNMAQESGSLRKDTISIDIDEAHARENFYGVTKQSLELFSDGAFEQHLLWVLKVLLPSGKDSISELASRLGFLPQLNAMRKKSFMHFISAYTQDISAALEIVQEIDKYNQVLEENINQTYINLLNDEQREFRLLNQRIAATLPAILYVLDHITGKMEYVNEAIHRMLGFTQEDIYAGGGDVLPMLIHPEDLPRALNSYEKLKGMQDGNVATEVLRIIDGQGIYHHFRFYYTPYKRNDAGEPFQEIGMAFLIDEEIARDSELARNASRLLESEQRHQRAEAAAKLGTWMYDGVTKELAWSAEVYRIYEHYPIGRPVRTADLNAFVVDEDMPQLMTRRRAMAEASTETINLTYRIRSGSGMIKVLQSHGRKVRDAEGRYTGYEGTVQDVTETHQLIHQLQITAQRYKLAERIAGIGIWTWDAGGDLAFWNDELFRIYGINRDEGWVSREAMREYALPQYRDIMFARLNESLSTGKPCEYDYKIKRSDGSVRVLQSRLHAELNSTGTVTRIIGAVQDITEQEEALAKLRRSEELLKEAQAVANTGNFTHDLNEHVYYWSDELYRIFELERDGEALQRSRMMQYVHPDDIQLIRENHLRLAVEGGKFDYQYRIITAQGHLKWIASRGYALEQPGSKGFMAYGIAQDVTERTLLLNDLKEQQLLLSRAQAIGKIGSWTYDIITDAIKWSDECYHIYNEPIGSTISLEVVAGYMQPHDRELFYAHLQRCLKYGVSYQFHYSIHNGATILHARGEAIRDAEGKITRIIGTVQDVTVERSIEQRLRENQHFSQKISNATPAIITVFSPRTGQYTYVSKACEQLLGYSVEEWMNGGLQVVGMLLHPDDAPAVWEKNDAALAAANELSDRDFEDDHIVEFRYRMRHKDGHYRWLQTYAIVFDRDEQGHVAHILNVSIDVSSTVEAEQQIFIKNQLLAQSNASLEEFAYIASHDLQEPLRKISTFGNMLQSLTDAQLDERTAMYLNKIVDSSVRMQSMINDILAISVISGDKGFVQTNLQTVLEEVLQTLEHKIEQAGAVVDVSQQLPDVTAIPSQMRQLFQNLIANAIKFSRAGVAPRIHIRAAGAEAMEKMSAGLDPAKPYLKLDFADNGIGFDNMYANKIFAIFQRLHGRSEYEGSGIGLAICRKIVMHHGGAITASAQPGEGAVFTIFLPQ